MKILVVGVTGMLGKRISTALVKSGHTVVGAGRTRPRGLYTSPGSFVTVDFSVPVDEQWWLPRLDGVDVVINAVGIFRESKNQTFEALHHEGPAVLFRACAQKGTPFVIQVSALGSDASATTSFHKSKWAAERALRRCGVDSAIVHPSLVYAPEGQSSRLFRQISLLPMLVSPAHAWVQPVLVDDLVEGVEKLVLSCPVGATTVAFVGSTRQTFADYLFTLRKGMGVQGKQKKLELSRRAFLSLAGLAGKFSRSPLNRDSASMLLRGNTAPVDIFQSLLGRPPRASHEFIGPVEGAALLAQAKLDWLLPILQWSLAFVWIWTALVSLGLYPVQQSFGLLSSFGLHGAAATAALYGAAVFDLLLGFLTVAAKGKLWRWGLVCQLALISAYTLMITVKIPEWWLHPFGPISKNLPMMVGISILLALGKRG